VDWIVAHYDTLEELLLHECAIAITLSMIDCQAETNYPGEKLPLDPEDSSHYFVQVSLRWHEVLGRIRLDLPRLKHFILSNDETAIKKAFENSNNLISEIEYSRYLTFDNDVGNTSWLTSNGSEGVEDEHNNSFLAPQCKEEDKRALRELLDAIDRRVLAKK
jgi:hypothetical protein